MRFLAALWIAWFSLTAQADPVAEYDMKATYLYNFAAFTEWPESDRYSFNLCTLGDENVAQALRRFEGRRIGKQRLTVARLSSLGAIRNCQLLFVGEREVVNLPRIAAELGDEPVLTVSDAALLPQVGIVLSLENQRLVFDVNFEQCRRLNLRPSSNLLRLARTVRKAS